MRYAKEHGEIYAITGMGKATVEEQIALLTYVEKEVWRTSSGRRLIVSRDRTTTPRRQKARREHQTGQIGP